MKKSFIKSVSLLLTFITALSFCLTAVGCNKEKLATPAGVTASDDGLISWTAVKNADGYVVKINGEEYSTDTTSYQVQSVVNDFTYSVKATAEKHEDSDYTETYTFKGKGTPIVVPAVTVAINAPEQIYSGASVKLKANVSGTVDASVTWAILEGSEYATIDAKGNLTANEVSGDKIIKVEARSKVDDTAYAEKVLTIVATPTLTQDMLDALNDDYVSFSGYVNIDLYRDGSLGSDKLEGTYTSVIKTAMNGTYWYSEYENGTTGRTMPLYYKKDNDKACQVGVSYMNEEEYFPMTDEYGKEVSWEDAGLYNGLRNLEVSDFTFDTETWRYVYNGNDKEYVQRIIASANPYDFSANDFALIIDDGEIVGIYSKSNYDYTIQTGYKAIQHLYVVLTIGEDSVTVPNITKYSHDKDWHPQLQEAINNMRALENYTVDFFNINATAGSGYSQAGFTETITKDLVLYKPFNAITNTSGEEVRTYTEGGEYGYKTIRNDLYNSFGYDANKESYYASRAYSGAISDVKPTFAFAAEIFTTPMPNKDDGSITYYVADEMSSVASTFFYGVGNDINLYGLFATRGYVSATSSFTPYVTVKDGYITDACFYYNIGNLLYGVVELTYSDFNTATIPDAEIPEFTTREIPTSWSQLELIISGETEEDADVTVNALTYFTDVMFKGVAGVEENLPFFGSVLGDCFGFGLTSLYLPQGESVTVTAMCLYYDVPLDNDYTITTSMEKVKDFLREQGFTQKGNVFTKDKIAVVPTDSDLDFLIYVYRVRETQSA